MVQNVRITTAVVKVLAALVDDPARERYGLDLIRDTGLPSGTLYPILTRLERAGWVHAEWEDLDPVAEGRPARRYYRLTPDGVQAARTELAALYQRLSKADGLGARKPRTA
ncbi:PadR family transcriptional regulator [Allorhizocola rhizosphaerae]|uniref:PadR family transcriptional regulator n=1 Tax=Allorhizocola rhizosphaerae TaxID=1872709 RepID=UPI0014788CF4|nr:helix-turn-helix transcriptional regulator [Allorhizocola rhizosphaerae]